MRRRGRGVLRIAFRELRDGRGAEADQHFSAVVGVALEVSAKKTGALGRCKPVFRPGEMVDADLGIPVPDEEVARGFKKPQAVLGTGQEI